MSRSAGRMCQLGTQESWWCNSFLKSSRLKNQEKSIYQPDCKGRKKSWCSSSKATGQEEFCLPWGGLVLLFSSGLQRIGRGPPTWGSTICFTQATSSNRVMSDQVSGHLHDPAKPTHKISRHSECAWKCFPMLGRALYYSSVDCRVLSSAYSVTCQWFPLSIDRHWPFAAIDVKRYLSVWLLAFSWRGYVSKTQMCKHFGNSMCLFPWKFCPRSWKKPSSSRHPIFFLILSSRILLFHF